MKTFKTFLERARHEIQGFRFTSSFFWRFAYGIGIFLLFFFNAFHESYPDEFDNIAGGWEILHGTFLYKGYFTHHGPVPYFLSAFIEIFSGQSFVRFRIVYGIFLAIISLLAYKFLKRQLGALATKYFPFYIFLFGLWATYYWSHMLLADNIAALCFVVVYALIISRVLYKQLFTRGDILFISIVSSLGLYSSLTYLYLYLITTITTLGIYYWQNEKLYLSFLGIKTMQSHQQSEAKKTKWSSLLFPLYYFAVPHILWFVYLVLTGSFKDYYFMNYVFNTKYYIYNYPRPEGVTTINPLRYAILIMHEFFNNYRSLLLGVKDFGFAYPVNMTLAIGNVAMVVYLLLRRHYKMVLFIVLVLIYSNVRSNPLQSGETDYQSAVYIFVSFFNTVFILRELYTVLNDRFNLSFNGINEHKEFAIDDVSGEQARIFDVGLAQKVIFGFLLLLTGVYFSFCLLFLLQKWGDKYYPKYMGKAPLIYNRPTIAPILNSVISPNDYVWVGPFNFEELFYTNAKFASKYQILIPGFGKSQEVQNEMIADFTKTQPVIVVFNKNFFILGSQAKSYSQFFLDYLNANYITLLPYKNGNKIYRSAIPVTDNMDLETQWYIRKDKANEIINKLLQNGYIKEETVK